MLGQYLNFLQDPFHLASGKPFFYNVLIGFCTKTSYSKCYPIQISSNIRDSSLYVLLCNGKERQARGGLSAGEMSGAEQTFVGLCIPTCDMIDVTRVEEQIGTM
jgi:hypothetical protein